MENCTVNNLFLKRRHGIPMTETQNLNLIKEYGIEGDVNAHGMSPRQILIANYEYLVEKSISPGDLRENVVIKNVNLKQFKPGAIVEFSGGVQIRLTFYCEPCKRILHLVDSLKSIEKKRGILGVVIKEGKINLGDSAIIIPNCFAPLPEKPYERFIDFLAKVPSGKVVSYKQIVKGIGVAESYFRAIPTYIKKTSGDYPIHRILDSKGYLIPQHIKQQKILLESEGIKVIENQDLFGNSVQLSVSMDEYSWKDSSLYLK